METIYAIFTKGMIESRKSFLYGPFCIIYGIAALILVLFLRKYKKQNVKLFIFGMIVGCLIEYFSSYFGEILFHVKWWDYSNDFFNIHGRTCLYYAVLWGILSIFLINYINPIINKFLDELLLKKQNAIIKTITSLVTVFIIFDALITCYALDNFLVRVSNEYNIAINGVKNNEYDTINYSNMFSNEKMMMTYPNIIVVSDNNEIVYLESVLNDVKNYYYKF